MAVDGEFGLAIQNDKHLLALIVKVLPDSALWLNDAAMQKLEVCLERVSVEQRRVIQCAGSGVYRGAFPVLGGIGVENARSQRLPRDNRHERRYAQANDDRNLITFHDLSPWDNPPSPAISNRTEAWNSSSNSKCFRLWATPSDGCRT